MVPNSVYVLVVGGGGRTENLWKALPGVDRQRARKASTSGIPYPRKGLQSQWENGFCCVHLHFH